MKEIEMKYSDYKNEWSNCRTVNGSYDAENKIITVLIPDCIYALSQVIPHDEVEAYKSELVEAGSPEFANTGKVMELYMDELRGLSLADFDSNAPAWVAQALEIVNR